MFYKTSNLKIESPNDFWTWLIAKLSVGLRANEWYNNGQPFGLAGFINDFSSRMVGFAMLRQLRVKNSNKKFRLFALYLNLFVPISK